MNSDAGRRPPARFRFGTWDPERHYRDDLYWARVLNAVHQRTGEVGAELIDLPTPEDASDEATFDEVVLRARSVGVDVILDWPFPETPAFTMLRAGIPIVHLSETSLHHPLLVAPQGLEAVAFDLVVRAAEAIGGSGTLLVVGGGMQLAHSDDGASRLRGAQRAATTLPGIDLLHVPTLWDERAGDQVERALRREERTIDAVVGFSDLVASVARRRCAELGRIGPQVPTFGINGTPDAIAEILTGSMAGTVEVLADDVGRQAVDMAVAVAARTQYPAHYLYRTRYIDASSAAKVAARMLIDFGSALRAPRPSFDREQRVRDRLAGLSSEANEAFLRSRSPAEAWRRFLSSLQAAFDAHRVVVAWPQAETPSGPWVVVASDEVSATSMDPDGHWVEVAASTWPKVGVAREAAASTLVPFGVGDGPFGCLDVVHAEERIMTLTEVDTLRDVADHAAGLAGLRAWDGRGVGLQLRRVDDGVQPAVTVWIESAADGASLVRELKRAAGDAAITIRRLPASRRATWRWTTQGASPGSIDVISIVRWTPEASEWISRWREDRRGGRCLLVMSDIPWPAEALKALPRDVPCVVHTTMTLPVHEAAAWVSGRVGGVLESHVITDVARVRSTVAQIHAGYMETLGRAQLAQEAELGVDRLTRLFREVMGVTPRTYRSRLRVHHAMRLLVTTDLSVTEIGYRVGWHDPAQFSSSFKRLVGRSPRAFRRENAPALVGKTQVGT